MQDQYDALAQHNYQLEQRLGYLQVQAERAASLEYACNQLHQRVQDADSRVLELQGTTLPVRILKRLSA